MPDNAAGTASPVKPAVTGSAGVAPSTTPAGSDKPGAEPAAKPPSIGTIAVLSLTALAMLGTALFALNRLRASSRANDPADPEPKFEQGLTSADGEPLSRVSGAPMGVLPAFSLTTADGKTLTDRDMLGKVWVADLFFIACKEGCVVLGNRMGEVQSHVDGELAAWLAKEKPAVARKVGLLSVTVNPGEDDAAALTAYANSLSAGPRWKFVTGSKTDIRKLTRDGLLAAGIDEKEKHSLRMYLIDAGGKVRASYSVVPDGVDTDAQARATAEFERLKSDLRRLVTETADAGVPHPPAVKKARTAGTLDVSARPSPEDVRKSAAPLPPIPAELEGKAGPPLGTDDPTAGKK